MESRSRIDEDQSIDLEAEPPIERRVFLREGKGNLLEVLSNSIVRTGIYVAHTHARRQRVMTVYWSGSLSSMECRDGTHGRNRPSRSGENAKNGWSTTVFQKTGLWVSASHRTGQKDQKNVGFTMAAKQTEDEERTEHGARRRKR